MRIVRTFQQKVLMEADNGHLFPRLQPVIAQNSLLTDEKRLASAPNDGMPGYTALQMTLGSVWQR
jgi:hypothetical protein